MLISLVRKSLVLLFLGLSVNASADLNDYFVSTDWLNANLQNVRVVDVRNPALYLLGHIDGAVNISRGEFLSTRGEVKSLIPTAVEFKALMEKYGIDADSTVVAYASDDDPYSARFVWMMKYHGHEKAYVLDGGYTKWANEERATSLLTSPDFPRSRYELSRAWHIRAEAGEILTRIGHPGVVVWDTRRPGEYEGTEVRADRGGHIPGAVHLNWTELQTERDGTLVLKEKDDILKLLAGYGITPDKEIIPHCQTGIRSSYATLVLLGLGYGQVKNYDGSWFEWANNPELPVLTGRDSATPSGQLAAMNR